MNVRPFQSVAPVILLFLAISPSLAGGGSPEKPTVRLIRTPGHGLQPQAAVDPSGTVHLIYYKGDPAKGDIFHVRKTPGQTEFTQPVRVNSLPGTAIAMGTIRGAQLAVGKKGRVHVIWNGHSAAQSEGRHEGPPLFYTRLNDEGTAFEPQRDLITYAGGLDGGSSIAADPNGNVYAAWHAHVPGAPRNEQGRGIFLAVSRDDGKSFAREVQVNPPETGVCACCGMRTLAGKDGALFILYRAAFDATRRDQILLASSPGERPFKIIVADPWTLPSCPMSSAALAASPTGTIAAWENAGKIFWTRIVSRSLEPSDPTAAPGDGASKHPAIAVNQAGQMLLAWTEGTGWKKGGKLKWQLYGSAGELLHAKGETDGVPPWSLITAVAEPDNSFVVIY